VIASERLDLVALSPAFMTAALEGRHADAEALLGARIPPRWGRTHERLLRLRLDQLEQDPGSQPWLLRAVVLRERDRRIIGHIGFHAPPDARGAVEVGYAIEPEYRRRGFAREAVRALFGWATETHAIHHFVASVSPTNQASLGLIRQLGFHQTGSQMDEIDGLELVFELQTR
jgi:[ribosomal protein S5]-alanine N-acetyltransferase